MALSPAQLVTVAEILRYPLADLEDAASSLTAEQESSIADDIDLWEDNRNDVDVWLSGSGVNYMVQELLNAIRQRMRDIFSGLGVPIYSRPTFFTLASGTRGR